MKKIGVLYGMENTFPGALVDKINSRNLDDIHAVLELRPHGAAHLVDSVGDREVALLGEHDDVRLR